MLEGGRRACVIQRNATLFRQGEQPQGIYCLRAGYMLSTRTDPAGNEAILDLLTGGDLVGCQGFFAGRRHATSARAVTACSVCFIPGPTVLRLLDSNPGLTRAMLRSVAGDPRPMTALMLRSPGLSVRGRLVHLLLVLKERCAEALPDGRLVFDIPLTRRDIAAMIGVRPESISRAVHDLQDEGVASFQGHQIVSTLQGLLAIARSEATH